jgi:YbbR domain-containing protein
VQTDHERSRITGVFEEWRSGITTPSRWRLWHNFPQKLGALVAAIVLWFAATADRRATIQRSLEVPLIVRGASADLVVSDLPKTIRVTLEGNRTRLEGLPSNLIEASVDVSSLPDGFFSRPVTVTPPAGLNLVKLEPARASGTLNAVVREKTDVRAALLETPGAPPLKIKVNPSEVTVIGTRPQVERVAYALAVGMRQVAPNKPLEVRLTAMDTQGKPVEGVTLEPSRARISQ